MAETTNKPKLQLRSGAALNGAEKTPSPATKLLINHGKPNFTIQRGPTKQNGESNQCASPAENNWNPNYTSHGSISKNNYCSENAFNSANGSDNNNNSNNNNNVIIKSTKFNGVFKPSFVPLVEKQTHQQNAATDNEAARVTLRRTKGPEPPKREEEEDDTVPEFIRRQRRIQERLTKENILDFENRRSGYFTHTIITPTSPNRTSFVETMSSPAIVPSLEIPPPAQPKKQEEEEEVIIAEIPVENNAAVAEKEEESDQDPATNNVSHFTNGVGNGHVEEEEVARAIEEVNKAVAGEDDDKIVEVEPDQKTIVEPEVVQVEVEKNLELHEATTALTVEHNAATNLVETVTVKPEHPQKAVDETISAAIIEEVAHTVSEHAAVEVHVEAASTADPTPAAASIPAPVPRVVEEIKQNGHIEVAPKELQQNGHIENVVVEVINSTQNGSIDGPRIPNPDPSGVLGVNYEPKTVVSFSKDLGSEPNNHPDTVKITKEGTTTIAVDPELQGLTKLKFDIKADEQSELQVTPVLKTE